VPVAVTGITSAIALGVGSGQDCAVLSDHSVTCWGDNQYGGLGNGSSAATSTVPVAVVGATSASSLAGGIVGECSLSMSGTVSCWGYGTDGELGNGASMNATTPVSVTGVSGAQALGAGWYHTCAIPTGGKVQCWGMGTNGQLGNGNTASSNLPVNVLNLTGATQVSGGESHTCALAGGQVWCWGDETNGALGNGVSAGSSAVPVQVQQLF